MAMFCYRWGNCNIPWNLANWKWSECQIVADIISGFGGNAAPNIPDWLREDKKDEEKRKRFITLLTKVKNKVYKEEKEVRYDVKVSVDDIKLVVKTVSGIDIEINENIRNIQDNQLT